MSIDGSYKTNGGSVCDDDDGDSIPSRIQFVRSILNNNILEPLIDFDNTDTENFINIPDDDDSKDSYDTRIALKKKVHYMADVLGKMGGTMRYINSGTTGHTFKGFCMDDNNNVKYEYAIKVVAYPKKNRYGTVHDTTRPENAELMMIKLLSYFIVKRRTPHLVLPIGTFDTDIDHFTNLVEKNMVNAKHKRYKEFINNYKKGLFHDKVSILISEWANRGDFLDYMKKNYKRFTPLHWKVFFFQLISTLAVIQSKFPTFRHNDLKANNVLITKISKKKDRFQYRVAGNIYRVPNTGYQLKIWDFDFACIPGIVNNKKVMVPSKNPKSCNLNCKENKYYDIHYFFNSLITRGFFPQILTDIHIPQEVKDFVNSIVPPEYQKGANIAQGGRILIDVEYTTPAKILESSAYFNEFRVSRLPRSAIMDQFLTGGDDKKNKKSNTLNNRR